MQTLRAGCSKAEPKFFAPLHTRFQGARDGQNLISWRWSLPLPTNPVWWGSMHPQTHKYSHKPTDRTDYSTPCCSLACSVMTQVHPVTQASTSRDEIVRSEQQTGCFQSQWNEYWTNTSSLISSHRHYKCDVLSLGLDRNDLYNTNVLYVHEFSVPRLPRGKQRMQNQGCQQQNQQFH